MRCWRSALSPHHDDTLTPDNWTITSSSDSPPSTGSRISNSRLPAAVIRFPKWVSRRCSKTGSGHEVNGAVQVCIGIISPFSERLLIRSLQRFRLRFFSPAFKTDGNGYRDDPNIDAGRAKYRLTDWAAYKTERHSMLSGCK